MSKNYSGLTIKIYYLETPSDQPVASSYVLQLFFDFGQTFFPFFDDLVPLKLKSYRDYDSFGSFATPRFSFCLVPGNWINWTFLGAT